MKSMADSMQTGSRRPWTAEMVTPPVTGWPCAWRVRWRVCILFHYCPLSVMCCCHWCCVSLSEPSGGSQWGAICRPAPGPCLDPLHRRAPHGAWPREGLLVPVWLGAVGAVSALSEQLQYCPLHSGLTHTPTETSPRRRGGGCGCGCDPHPPYGDVPVLLGPLLPCVHPQVLPDTVRQGLGTYSGEPYSRGCWGWHGTADRSESNQGSPIISGLII